MVDWLTELPAWRRSLLGVYYCYIDTMGQSLHSWYVFNTSILAPEAVDGFRMFGLAKCADIIAEANSYFGNTYPRDLRERSRSLPEYEKRDLKFPFSELGSRFRLAIAEEIGDEGLEVISDRYICARLGLVDRQPGEETERTT